MEGFTLIELSVVLIIIGLLVGAILVGRDLIRAAEIRATISQIDKYKAAVHTFQLKYDAIPGDINANSAASFGFTARSGAGGHGDGNGFVEGCASGSTGFGCETALFWQDLSNVNLIDVSITSATDTVIAVNMANSSQYMPAAKLGRGNYFGVFSSAGYNYFLLASVSNTNWYRFSQSLTPMEAWAIDTKIDDGLPGDGTDVFSSIVTAYDAAQPTVLTNLFAAMVYPSGVTQLNGCLEADASGILRYARSDMTNAETIHCIITIRMQ